MTESFDVPVDQLLKASPDYFINAVFNYLILPHHYNILDHIKLNQRSLDLAPRGTGKSRMLIGYAAWYAINNPDKRVLYLSDTDAHAMRFLATIKNTIESSELLRSVYGDIRNPKKWTEHEIVFKTRSKIFTEANLTAYGMSSGGVTGGHYELIVMDDICNFTSSRADTQREKDKDWLKTSLMPTAMPGCEIHGVGTRYHYSDVWEEVIRLGFDTNIQMAIKEDGTSIWGKVLPLHDRIDNGIRTIGLDTLRGDLGPIIFNLQYMNDTSLLLEGNIFKSEWIKYYHNLTFENGSYFIQRDKFKTKILKVILGCDLAISQKDSADFTVITAVGQGEDKKLYCLDVSRGHLTFQQQKDTIRSMVERWDADKTVIESVAYQAVMIEELRAEGGMKIVPVTPTKDKISRAMSITGFFENGNIYFRKNMMDVIDELLLFPDATRDDFVDSLYYAVSAFKQPSSEMVVISI